MGLYKLRTGRTRGQLDRISANLILPLQHMGTIERATSSGPISSGPASAERSDDAGLEVWSDGSTLPIACRFVVFVPVAEVPISGLRIHSPPAQVILYTPPDAGRLRFFSISNTQRMQSTSRNEWIHQDASSMGDHSSEAFTGLAEILPLVSFGCHNFKGLVG